MPGIGTGKKGTEAAVRIENGRWVCSWCGAVVDIPTDKTWRTEIHATGGHANERVVMVEGKEVHRCGDPTRNPSSAARRTVGMVGPLRARPISAGATPPL